MYLRGSEFFDTDWAAVSVKFISFSRYTYCVVDIYRRTRERDFLVINMFAVAFL